MKLGHLYHELVSLPNDSRGNAVTEDGDWRFGYIRESYVKKEMKADCPTVTLANPNPKSAWAVGMDSSTQVLYRGNTNANAQTFREVGNFTVMNSVNM